MSALLDRLLLAAAARLAPSAGPPLRPGAPVHVTTVARLPARWRADLAEPLAQLRARFPGHYVYPASTIHLTIRNLDPLGDRADAELVELIAETLGTFPPASVEVLGLRCGRYSAYLQLAAEPSLRRLRRRLAELVPARPTLVERARERVFVSNLVRFGPAPRPSAADLRPLAARLGRWRVDEIELVRTDRLLSEQETLVVSRFQAGRRANARSQGHRTSAESDGPTTRR